MIQDLHTTTKFSPTFNLFLRDSQFSYDSRMGKIIEFHVGFVEFDSKKCLFAFDNEERNYVSKDMNGFTRASRPTPLLFAKSAVFSNSLTFGRTECSATDCLDVEEYTVMGIGQTDGRTKEWSNT